MRTTAIDKSYRPKITWGGGNSINSEGVDCTTACYVKHLEPNNIDYPLKFS